MHILIDINICLAGVSYFCQSGTMASFAIEDFYHF